MDASQAPIDEFDAALALFDYSPDSWKKSLSDLIHTADVLDRKYDTLRGTPILTDEDLKCLVFGRFSAYILNQLRRTDEWCDRDNDILAWISRTLEEVKSLVNHLAVDVKHIYTYIT